MTTSKYHNHYVKEDGYTFDSKAEAARYRELGLLEMAGEISDLEVHPVYVLQPAFTDAHGTRFRAITYEADFRYYERGVCVIEDVKGVETDAFRIKWALLARQHPELDMRLIKSRGGWGWVAR